MWYLSDSKIHGVGIYAKEYIRKNQVIDLAIDGNKKITLFGSKLNHSWKPNANLYKINDMYYIVAEMAIQPFTEITVNYTNTPDFIKKPKLDWK